MSRYTWYDKIFISFIVLGVLLAFSSIIFFKKNLPLSGSVAVLMGLIFSVGARIDWIRFNKRHGGMKK